LRVNHQRDLIKEQLDTILHNTLENMEAFDFRDTVTTALELAQIVKQVGPFVGITSLLEVCMKFFMFLFLELTQNANN
jgi:hypothetical protein